MRDFLLLGFSTISLLFFTIETTQPNESQQIIIPLIDIVSNVESDIDGSEKCNKETTDSDRHVLNFGSYEPRVRENVQNENLHLQIEPDDNIIINKRLEESYYIPYEEVMETLKNQDVSYLESLSHLNQIEPVIRHRDSLEENLVDEERQKALVSSSNMKNDIEMNQIQNRKEYDETIDTFELCESSTSNVDNQLNLENFLSNHEYMYDDLNKYFEHNKEGKQDLLENLVDESNISIFSENTIEVSNTNEISVDELMSDCNFLFGEIDFSTLSYSMNSLINCVLMDESVIASANENTLITNQLDPFVYKNNNNNNNNNNKNNELKDYSLLDPKPHNPVYVWNENKTDYEVERENMITSKQNDHLTSIHFPNPSTYNHKEESTKREYIHELCMKKKIQDTLSLELTKETVREFFLSQEVMLQQPCGMAYVQKSHPIYEHAKSSRTYQDDSKPHVEEYECKQEEKSTIESKESSCHTERSISLPIECDRMCMQMEGEACKLTQEYIECYIDHILRKTNLGVEIRSGLLMRKLSNIFNTFGKENESILMTKCKQSGKPFKRNFYVLDQCKSLFNSLEQSNGLFEVFNSVEYLKIFNWILCLSSCYSFKQEIYRMKERIRRRKRKVKHVNILEMDLETLLTITPRNYPFTTFGNSHILNKLTVSILYKIFFLIDNVEEYPLVKKFEVLTKEFEELLDSIREIINAITYIVKRASTWFRCFLKERYECCKHNFFRLIDKEGIEKCEALQEEVLQYIKTKYKDEEAIALRLYYCISHIFFLRLMTPCDDTEEISLITEYFKRFLVVMEGFLPFSERMSTHMKFEEAVTRESMTTEDLFDDLFMIFMIHSRTQIFRAFLFLIKDYVCKVMEKLDQYINYEKLGLENFNMEFCLYNCEQAISVHEHNDSLMKTIHGNKEYIVLLIKVLKYIEEINTKGSLLKKFVFKMKNMNDKNKNLQVDMENEDTDQEEEDIAFDEITKEQAEQIVKEICMYYKEILEV